MPQHNMIIENAAGASVRADINLALEALVTNSSGSAEPPAPRAYQWWVDVSNGLLKIRNAGNTAWISVLDLSTGYPCGSEFLTRGKGPEAAMSLASATPVVVDTLSLTAGEWDVWGTVCFSGTSATISNLMADVTPGTTVSLQGTQFLGMDFVFSSGATGYVQLPVSARRVSISDTTVVNLLAMSYFAGGTLGAFGTINARRVR